MHGETVLSPFGYRKIEDIVVGDELFSQDGTRTKVTGVFPQGLKKCYRVSFDDGTYLDVDDSHLWTVMGPRQRFTKNYNENGKEYENKQYKQWITVSTKELAEKYSKPVRPYNRYIIPTVKPIEFTKKPQLIEPYTMGALIGDGGLSDGVRFSTDDTEIFDYIPYEHMKVGNSKHDYYIYGIKDYIREYNLLGKHSWDKFVPVEYLYSDKEDRLEVLRGLMDTDGTICKDGVKVEFSTVSEQLAKDTLFLVRSLGGRGKIYERTTNYTYKGEKKQGRKSYRVFFRMDECPFKLKRKAERHKPKSMWKDRIILSVEPIGMKESTCIKVDHPSELFVAKDFIVTHNTTLVSCLHIWYAWGKRGIKQGSKKAWENAEYLTCALAPHTQQAEVVIRTIRQILTSTYSWTDPETEKLVSNKCKIEWFLVKANESAPMEVLYANGAKTLIRSTGEDRGKSIAAKAFGYIGYDEAGKSLHLEEEYKSTILPRTADMDGDIDLIGTPDADSPSFVFFQEMFWRGGGDNYPKQKFHYSHEGSALENPYLPKNYVQDMIDKYPPGDPYLQQVLYGKFISVGNKVFDHKAIIECSKEMPEYIPYNHILENGELKEDKINHRYIIGVDTAIGNDEMVYTVIDWTQKPFKVVRIMACKGNSKSPELHLQDFMDLFYHYNQNGDCRVILEVFNGESMRFYYDLPQDIRNKTKTFGTGKVMGSLPKKAGQVDRKADILIAARKLLDAHDIEFSENFRTLIQQLANYTQNDEKIKTDWTISFCLACFYATDGQPKQVVLEPAYISW